MIFKEIYVSRKEPIRIQTTQYTNAVPLVFRIMDWEIPANAIAQIYIKKPSGTMVFNNAEIDENDINVTATTQMTAEVGDNEGQIRVEANSKVLHTFVFTLEVSETIIDDSAIESTDEFTALETALAEVENFVPKTAVVSKGSATQPVYFDSNGVAQNTTYPLKLNAVTQAGLVPAPTSSKSYNVYATNDQGSPQWESDSAFTSIQGIYGDQTAFQKNFLLTSSNKYSNVLRRNTFYWGDATARDEFSGIPTELANVPVALGFREVLFRTTTSQFVIVTECYPIQGRMHYNYLNNGTWTGWRCVYPSIGNMNPTSYTPSFSWSNGSGLTVANIDFRCTRSGNLCIITGRFNITAFGSPGNSNLNITLPSGVSGNSNTGVGGYGVVHANASVNGARLLPRINPTNIALVDGAGGGYSSSVLTTGYWSIFVIFPIA